MQIQLISNNYQTQRTQKQNNPSFGASIIYGKEAPSIRALGNCLDTLKYNTLTEDFKQHNFFHKAATILLQSLRSIATHNRTPENHRLFNCAIPVDEIAFKTGDITWLSNHDLSTDVGNRAFYATNHPESAKMVIKTISGASVEVPFNASEEQIAKTGEKIQNAAINMREQKLPTNSIHTYVEDPEVSQEIEPIQIDTL